MFHFTNYEVMSYKWRENWHDIQLL